MYGFPQARKLANELLEKRSNKHGYYQSKIIPGLWTHNTQPISFTLVVDDFRVKYVGEEHAEHLMSVLRKSYDVTHEWKGKIHRHRAPLGLPTKTSPPLFAGLCQQGIDIVQSLLPNNTTRFALPMCTRHIRCQGTVCKDASQSHSG